MKISSSFFERPVLEVAPDLIGCIFHYDDGKTHFEAEIMETEAYHEKNDASCHAHRGQTERNRVMFGKPGHLYVYFTYGMHHCMNIVCEPEGVAAAVLIRAMRPIRGIEAMRLNRGESVRDLDLMRGPARLCQAMGISRKQNGLFLKEKAPLSAWLEKKPHHYEVLADRRIGIRSAQEHLWRFLVADSPWVSKKASAHSVALKSL